MDIIDIKYFLLIFVSGWEGFRNVLTLGRGRRAMLHIISQSDFYHRGTQALMTYHAFLGYRIGRLRTGSYST